MFFFLDGRWLGKDVKYCLLEDYKENLLNKKYVAVCTNDENKEARTDPVLHLNVNDLVF